MAEDCTRRAFLLRLLAAHAAALLGCQRSGGQDWVARERVCIHVFDPRGVIPKPLWENPGMPPERGTRAYFAFGLPELALLTTPQRFLAMFPYFWPVTQEEIARLERTIEVRFQRTAISGATDVDQLSAVLRSADTNLRRGATSALLLTYNDYTRFWTPAILRLAKESSLDEVVLFKDPTLPPYLCEYPTSQKGFKKPPG